MIQKKEDTEVRHFRLKTTTVQGLYKIAEADERSLPSLVNQYLDALAEGRVKITKRKIA